MCIITILVFFLGERSNNSTKEWKDLCEGQIKSSGQRETPFFYSILPLFAFLYILFHYFLEFLMK